MAWHISAAEERRSERVLLLFLGEKEFRNFFLIDFLFGALFPLVVTLFYNCDSWSNKSLQVCTCFSNTFVAIKEDERRSDTRKHFRAEWAFWVGLASAKGNRTNVEMLIQFVPLRRKLANHSQLFFWCRAQRGSSNHDYEKAE